MRPGKDNEKQLKLNFSAQVVPAVPEKRQNVVSFVDGATLKLRSDAIRRVVKAGIFELPAGLRSR